MAVASDLSLTAYRNIESGVTRRPSPENRRNIATALKVDPSWLDGDGSQTGEGAHEHSGLYALFHDALPDLPEEEVTRIVQRFVTMSPDQREEFISKWRELTARREEAKPGR